MNAPKLRIAIIGGGMAGLTCATALSKHDVDLTIYDKGRGPGGRMAARRVERADGTLRFDHGAQYFTVHDPDFAAIVQDWRADDVVAPWPAAGDHAFVGIPAMNAPIRHMADSLDVHWGKRVDHIAKHADGWSVDCGGDRKQYDGVIVAIPAEQAADLLADAGHEFAEAARQSVSAPCWATMAAFETPLPIDADAVRAKGKAVSWAARNSAKPAREGLESWVLHASPEYSKELLSLPKQDAAEAMLAQFFDQAAIPAQEPAFLTAHRWLYAMADAAGAEPCLWDAEAQIGVCGDWLVEPRVEGAWRSGRAMARSVLEVLQTSTPS